MSHRAFFESLVYDENGHPIDVAYIGGVAHYVVDDDGFRRHVEAESLDRAVIGEFLGQLALNKDIAVEQALRLMGSDDLFAKAAVESQIDSVDADAVLAQGLPPQAREWLGMMGLRIILNYRGELVRIDQPGSEIDE